MGARRVLQVVASTDLDDTTDAALTLHRALADCGDEVRTLALGPGRRGELQRTVPTLGPVARAMAARNQLRREAGWAGVLVAWGAVAAGVAVAVHRRGGPPTVAVLGAEARAWAGGGAPRSIARPASLLAALVRTDLDPDGPVDPALMGLDLPAARAVALPLGVDTRPPPTSPAARRAARVALDLPERGPVVRPAGLAPGPGDDLVVRAAAAAGVPVLARGPRHDDELVAAAADVVMDPGSAGGPPERGLLIGARSGAALVGSGHDGVVDDSTGACAGPGVASLAAALVSLADAERRAAAGAGARERVEERFDVARDVERWRRLLAGAAR
jgi:hypothetical protein